MDWTGSTPERSSGDAEISSDVPWASSAATAASVFCKGLVLSADGRGQAIGVIDDCDDEPIAPTLDEDICG